MSTTALASEFTPLVLQMAPLLDTMDDERFYAFCQANPELRIERTSTGEIVVMPPIGAGGGGRELVLAGLFFAWLETSELGVGFASSAGFTLPSGAVRSPDVSWVRRDVWEAVPEEERERFPRLCPDFVAELRSRSDSLRLLQAKMEEYRDAGVRLGWLNDPYDRTVYVYRPGQPMVRLDDPAALSGEPVLPGFTLDVRRLWV